MTDQIPADKVRPILDEWERIKEHADWVDMDNLVQSVRALLPAPTLADMTPEERAECRRMQADVKGYEHPAVIIQPYLKEGSARVMWETLRVEAVSWANITPRPDLPRFVWPGEQQTAPAPALPDGWRLAEHPAYGRVIVTNDTPSNDGNVYFVAPATDPIGNDWHFCKPAKLTYLDQEADQ